MQLLETCLGTCQKLVGGRGVETEGGSQGFETVEKEGVVKNGPLKGGGSICVRDHVEVHSQKKKEVLYFVKNTWEK